MANKQCKNCGISKPTSTFGKHPTTKDRLQTWCTDCRGISRNRIQKADKNAIIYSITNPLGQTYIGSTKMVHKYRMNLHRGMHKNNNGQYPLLHLSFDKFGFDNHKFAVVKELGNVSRAKMREIESIYIQSNMKSNQSLNKNK